MSRVCASEVCTTMQKDFVKIGKSVTEIPRFFNFSKWPLSTISDLFGACLDHSRVLRGYYHCAKFGYNRCSSFDNMNVSIFGTTGLKTPIHVPPNWSFWAILPLNGQQYQRNPERHILAWVRVIWTIEHENRSSSLTSRWAPKKW